MKIKSANWKVLTLLLLVLVFICLGLIITLVSKGMNYLFTAAGAIFSLAFFIILPIIQKRMSIYSVMALLIGLLFLASSVIDFGYSPFNLSMSISEKTKFYTILRPQQISLSLAEIGLGLLFVLFGFIQIKAKSLPNTYNQVYRILYSVQISTGVLLFTSGLYQVINGLYPSAYQFYDGFDIGVKLAIISFGLLLSWYIVLQPIFEKKKSMESFSDKSA